VNPASIVRRAAPDRVRLDPPLQHKVGWVVAIASMGGFGLGGYAHRYDESFWPLVGVMVFGLAVLWWLTGWWIVAPINQLANQAQRVARTGLASALKSLPTWRSDEIGRIAQALHDLGVASTRGYLQAQSLKRSMDHQIEIATRRATNELSRLVMRDALTDLGNRRFLDDKKEELFDQAIRSDQDLACIMIDLDNFKQVNDTLGHEAGDHLLVFLGGLIRAIGRSEDLAIRLGGDEFLLLMPGSDAGQGAEVARMIAKHFSHQAHTLFPDVRVLGLSFGVSSLKADGCSDLRSMMRLADQRLYEIKDFDRQ